MRSLRASVARLARIALPALATLLLPASGPARAVKAPAAAPPAPPAASGPTLVDGFEEPARWQARPADGVELTLHPDQGSRGRSLRLDFRFVKGGGYAVIHRDLALDLPENYRFRFRIRGRAPSENLEFKLVDSTGANVWWNNHRDFVFPAAWDSVTLRKRHIRFAWGPAGGGEIRHVAAIEFAVTAGSGGSGSVWLDELTLEPLPPPGGAAPTPRASASSSQPGHEPGRAADGDAATSWSSGVQDAHPWLTLALGTDREFGALALDWAPGRHLADYAVETSGDGRQWRLAREVRGGNGGRDWLYLPESEARWLRVRALGSFGSGGCALREITIEPLEVGASLESFFAVIAGEAPRGRYPRAYVGEQGYWTVLGSSGGSEEALLDEDGRLEPGPRAFSVEPFLLVGGRLVTWADVRTDQWLERGHLPIPSVRWSLGDLDLTVTAFADGVGDSSQVVARYRLRNRGDHTEPLSLFLALRPFQVNPPTQTLNTAGGTAAIRSLARTGAGVVVDGAREVTSLTPPSGFGAVRFDQGEIVEHLSEGRLPGTASVMDSVGLASGAFQYARELPAGGTLEVDLAVSPGPGARALPAAGDSAGRAEVAGRLAACAAAWETRVSGVRIALPDSDLVQTLEAQAADILVNRRGPALQPGPRAYARTWIRDGALTCSALLRLGRAGEVRDFIEWFAPFQFESGKVPCCVDRRGSDPVPEHDSNGEFIFLVAEYLRYTGDRALAARVWPAVERAAGYLDSLRQQRRTAEWRAPDQAAYFGLLPPSISHEGYSASPMHSYWDDFFALRGFKDAVFLAHALGQAEAERRLTAVRDEFQQELGASLREAMKLHGIDYLPGCADLGDFDATSTTIALSPVQAEGMLPAGALERTFERYWDFFATRRDSAWDAFTPYEWRAVGAMTRLGWRDRASQAREWLMRWRRPPGFRHWAEVVWRDPRAPRFLGDMPHTWVGSDFVRSILDLLAYERESDSALVIGAGIPEAWAAGEGVAVRGLRTRWGTLSYRLQDGRSRRTLLLEKTDLRVPPGGLVIAAPALRKGNETGVIVHVDGKPHQGPLVVRRLPARVEWLRYPYDAKRRYR